MFPVDRLPLAQAYADLLATQGVIRGLIGPREAPRLWSRHLLNSAVLEEQVPQGASVADVGSGAGLPGVALAIARPDVTVTLIEPLLRRATFLEETVRELGLCGVSVVRARGEDLHRAEELRPGFDVVTSRAVASFAQLLTWCMPLVAPTGAMVALKGGSVGAEVQDAARELREWQCAPPQVVELGLGRLVETTHAVRVAWSDPSSVTWPSQRRTTARPPRRRGQR
ncbi:16S rRNA (guanine(527)-N(7))-methyltransferase RsmG [Nocardioides sp.]|uniref:16S rRNA (guanine(527)-N(7))-methyltransferase RsmG n=1 Tax=Nocardioides sp. TaxID=35761 RepID=UPI002721ED57|nr:16S rRNA (guanine(527)-N(7))-methyltransferase RsmG [Nocardioides sp.]MDO9458208.1 16S rRNA (guanine(527)-N(7))-methyltransferase RsmG [Nocardioides sp.]